MIHLTNFSFFTGQITRVNRQNKGDLTRDGLFGQDVYLSIQSSALIDSVPEPNCAVMACL